MVKGRFDLASAGRRVGITQSEDLTALRTKKIHMGVTICILQYLRPSVRSKKTFLCSK